MSEWWKGPAYDFEFIDYMNKVHEFWTFKDLKTKAGDKYLVPGEKF